MSFDENSSNRAVAQLLQSWRQAGLTHWKSIPAAPIAAASATESIRSSPPLRATTVMPRGQLIPPEAVATPRALDPSRCRTFQPLDLSSAERRAQLAEWKDRVAQCVRCQELATTRKQTVFGVGNPEAKLLFVGEAPGADEDAQGEPFVGRAGQLLNDIIKACRMKREDVYICNILRCRPPGNRVPSLEEAENCREYLDAQIAIVNPDYIVCWGSTAAKNLLGSEDSIGKMRGKFFAYGRAKVLCTYHPSYLLRNPAAKKDVWDDMKFLFRDMGVDLTAK
jgi:DNA polymerase